MCSFAVDLFLQFNPQRAGRSSIGNGVGRPTGLGSVMVVESRVLRKGQTESSSQQEVIPSILGMEIPKRMARSRGGWRGEVSEGAKASESETACGFGFGLFGLLRGEAEMGANGHLKTP